jgi:hypothetical protein
VICEGKVPPAIVIVDKLALSWLIGGIKEQVVSIAAAVYDDLKITAEDLSATQSTANCEKAILGDHPASGLTSIADVEFTF